MCDSEVFKLSGDNIELVDPSSREYEPVDGVFSEQRMVRARLVWAIQRESQENVQPDSVQASL